MSSLQSFFNSDVQVRCRWPTYPCTLVYLFRFVRGLFFCAGEVQKSKYNALVLHKVEESSNKIGMSEWNIRGAELILSIRSHFGCFTPVWPLPFEHSAVVWHTGSYFKYVFYSDSRESIDTVGLQDISRPMSSGFNWNEMKENNSTLCSVLFCSSSLSVVARRWIKSAIAALIAKVVACFDALLVEWVSGWVSQSGELSWVEWVGEETEYRSRAVGE